MLDCLVAVPLADHANGNNDDASRCWIHTLNAEIRAGIDCYTFKRNPLTLALFGLATSVMAQFQARYAVQRFDERYCVVKHQSSS